MDYSFILFLSFVFSFIAILLIAINIIQYSMTTRTKIVKVISTSATVYCGASHEYTIMDEDEVVYYMYWFWSPTFAYEKWRKIQVFKFYEIEYSGFYVPLLRMYPYVHNVKPIEM